MATYFSNHFGTGTALTLAGTEPATLARDFKIGAGVGGARERYKRASMIIGTAAQIGDVLRMVKFKSGDRVKEIMLSSSGGSAGIADCGIYKSGRSHDGVVLDADLFASAQALTGTIARVDIFKESTTLKDIDRGKTLWELVTIGAAFTYTADPMEDWDLCLTMTAAMTTTLCTINLEVSYTSGD